ncbi:MAG TPA: hypothetical protein VJ744_05675 [Gaiellaceae bacterium]|nr:hypothetical protein [Gaiellaceae bacterium]
MPGLGMGFDRVDCALEASTAGVPLVEPPRLPIAARPQALALPVVAMAGGPSFPAMAAARTVPTLLVGANLALLTAGAAATIYLWLRVFSPDAAILPVPAENASVAFARMSIAAEIDLTLEPASRPQPETVAFGGGRGAPASPAAVSEAVAASNPGRVTTQTASNANEPAQTPSKGGGSGGPVVRPSPPPAPPPPPEEPSAPPPRQTPAPAPPVPTSPPDDRVPGPTLPTPGIPDSGPSGPGDGTRLGS